MDNNFYNFASLELYKNNIELYIYIIVDLLKSDF